MEPNGKQDEIVNAARELFNTFGFEKTTMTDIAKRIGISKASLYYYFTDKESIIRSLALKEQEQFVSEIQTIISEKSSTREKLFAYSEKRVELLHKRLTLSSANIVTYTSVKSIFSSIITEFRKQEINLLTQIFKIGMEKMDIQKIDAQEYGALYVDVLRGLRRNAFYNSEKIELSILQPDDIIFLQQQSKLFTEIFINSISL